MDVEHDELAMEVILNAGRLMIESGSDMARVDDTMYRIARNAGIVEPRIFETTTGIMMTAPKTKLTRIEPINKRRIDLELVSRGNQMSRDFQAGNISLEEMRDKLVILSQTAPTFKISWQVFAAAAVSATLMVMYGGKWIDFLPALIIGGISYYIYWYINTKFRVKFVSEFLAAVSIGLMSALATHYHLASDMSMVAIGAIMPLVPGVPLTNAVRDVLAGHLLSGIARGTEALISACAIGFGIAVVLRFL